MSLRADGHYHCDRCGLDLGPASGVAVAAIISDIDPAIAATPLRLELCRDRPDPEREGKTIQGCRDRVLTKKALRDYLAYLDAQEPPA